MLNYRGPLNPTWMDTVYSREGNVLYPAGMYYLKTEAYFIATRTQSRSVYIYVLMRDEKEGRRSKHGQINNKAKQHSTPNVHVYVYIILLGAPIHVDQQVEPYKRAGARCRFSSLILSASIYTLQW